MEEQDQKGRIPKIERLLNLVAFLLKSKRPVSFEEIKQQVVGYTDDFAPRVLERRFTRDKQELRKFGVPIEYQGEGYTIPKSRYFLAPFHLSREDALLVRSLARLAEGGPIPVEEVEAAVQKLACDAAAGPLIETSDAELIVLPPSRGEDPEARNLFLAVVEAIGNCRRIRFRHAEVENGSVASVLEPYGLGFGGGAWRLVGRSVEDGKLKSFRMDRIVGKIERIGQEDATAEFGVPEDFDMADYLGRPAWELGKGEALPVRIEFAPTYAWHVRDTLAGSARFEPTTDGGGCIHLEVRNFEPLVRWILERLPHVVAIEPESLRERILATLDAIEHMYGEARA